MPSERAAPSKVRLAQQGFLLPAPAQNGIEGLALRFFQPEGMQALDFSRPAGEMALVPPDSVSWQIFKNPLALFIGGVAAVVLELAEPRVRAGVWHHTSFRSEPVQRLQRTGLAAMVTVYAARGAAETMIAHIRQAHARVQGRTEAGIPYSATDPVLLNWVQATASYGFLEAYHAYVSPLCAGDRNRFLQEAEAAAALYGATGAPRSTADMTAQFAAMRPLLEPSEIIREFLSIIRRAPVLPAPFRPLQRLMVRAALAILPACVRETLMLDAHPWPWERRLLRVAGSLADRLILLEAPPAQACRRLGLPERYLYDVQRLPALP